MPTRIGNIQRQDFSAEQFQEASEVESQTETQDVFELAQPKMLGPLSMLQHFETEITPKSEQHLSFLRGCAGFEGSNIYGKVHANLRTKFWSWYSGLDPSVIRQAYIDAVLLTSEYSSGAADSLNLVDQAQIPNDWGPAQRRKIGEIRTNALARLEPKIGNHVSRKEQKEYAAVTKGCSMKKDLEIYRRSERFHKQLEEFCSDKSPVLTKDTILRMMSKNKHERQATVIALKRLQRMHEQS